MPEQTDAFTIPGPLLRSIIQYLAGRPYAEVAGLMNAINMQARQRPPSQRKLRIGTFSQAEMGCPHCGQRERGTTRSKRSAAGAGTASSPASSAHSACQERFSITGRRWMTTLRKLPTQSPAKKT